MAIPHGLYDANHSQGIDTLSPRRLARSRAYADRLGPLPPGIAFYSPRTERKRRMPYVADGNHRALAAVFRGEPTATFYVPEPDALRFLRLFQRV